MGEIERLKQELLLALDKINETDKMLDEIDKKLNNIKAKESRKGKWKPKEDEPYWYRDYCGGIEWENYHAGNSFDDYVVNNMPIFSTKEECEKYWAFMDKLKEKSYEFSEAEWEDVNIFKYYICYGYAVKRFCVNRAQSIREAGSTYFKTKEDALYIIDNYKEELLKYCFGMEG